MVEDIAAHSLALFLSIYLMCPCLELLTQWYVARAQNLRYSISFRCSQGRSRSSLLTLVSSLFICASTFIIYHNYIIMILRLLWLLLGVSIGASSDSFASSLARIFWVSRVTFLGRPRVRTPTRISRVSKMDPTVAVGIKSTRILRQIRYPRSSEGYDKQRNDDLATRFTTLRAHLLMNNSTYESAVTSFWLNNHKICSTNL